MNSEEKKIECPICKGTGESNRTPAHSNAKWPCVPCRGTGQIPESKLEEVKERYRDG